MQNHLILLRVTTGLLYLGPLLAGLIGQGWTMVPAFTVIFLIWSVIIRPHLWPTNFGDLTKSDGWVALITLIVTQLLIVVICFAIGRGIGGVLVSHPPLHFYLPLSLSVLAVPLSRLIWNPRLAAAHAGFDPLVEKLVNELPETDSVKRILGPVNALPDNITEAELQEHLTAIAAYLTPQAIRQGLADALADGEISRAGIKALIVHATDPSVNRMLGGEWYPVQAFNAARYDAEFLSLFAIRCLRALDSDRQFAADCPTADRVASAAQKVADPTAATLERLSKLLAQARSEKPLPRPGPLP